MTRRLEWKNRAKRRNGITARFTEYWSVDGRYVVQRSKSWFSGLPVIYRAILVNATGQRLLSNHRVANAAFAACERHARQTAIAAAN